MNFTKDQISTALRYIYTAAGSIVATLILLGWDKVDAERIGEIVKGVGDTVAAITTAVAILVPIIAGIVGTWRASSKQQIARVEQANNGVEVKPVSAEGAALVKKATGIDKPVEPPAQ